MLEIKHLTKRYQDTILDDLSITFPTTGLYFIYGKSGCGKTTLLHILGGLDKEYQGTILYQGKALKEQLNLVSFLFQDFFLIDWMTGKQNAVIGSYFSKIKKYDPSSINHNFSLHKRINQLSGGQKQRVSLLRASLMPSTILLCDEPLSNLDQENSDQLFEYLKQQSKHQLILLVSHTMEYRDQCDGWIELVDGKIERQVGDFTQKNSVLQPVTNYKKALYQLVLQQIYANKKRYWKLCGGICLAISAIIFVFCIGQGVHKQVLEEVEAVLPVNTYLVTSKTDSFTSAQIEELKSLCAYSYFETSSQYLVGISLESSKEMSVMPIYDASKEANKSNMFKGTIPKNDHEIVLSISTTKSLFQRNDVEDVLGEKLILHYSDGITEQEKEVVLVGISNEYTMIDSIYLQNHANLHHIQELYEAPIKSSIAMIDINDDKQLQEIRTFLKKECPSFVIEHSSSKVVNQVDDWFTKITIGLGFFCVLGVLSSCFLIGEVLYLSVLERTKENAIFQCFGATKKQIKGMLLFELIILLTISWIVSLSTCIISSAFLNAQIHKLIPSVEKLIVIDYKLCIILYIGSLGIGILASLLPAILASKQDPITCLKNS